MLLLVCLKVVDASKMQGMDAYIAAASSALVWRYEQQEEESSRTAQPMEMVSACADYIMSVSTFPVSFDYV
jgi:hypothetical protein